MKDKKELLYKRALITCVIMLLASIILKLFGSTMFNLETDIPLLQKIDNIIMSNVSLSFIYSFILMFINSMLIFMIVTKKKISKTNLFMLTIFSIGMIMYKVIYSDLVLSFILEILGFLLICVLEIKKISTIKECILTLLLNLIYQVISLFIRNLGFQLSMYGLTISVLFLIDYYIMLVITYLYLKKGDMTLCLIFHRSFSCLRDLLLKKRTRNLKQCLNKGENDG